MYAENGMKFKSVISAKEFFILILLAMIVLVAVVGFEGNKHSDFSFVNKDYRTELFSFGIYYLKYKDVTFEYDLYIRLFGIKLRSTNVENHGFLDDFIMDYNK